MAAATTPAPGTTFGPCVEPCTHRDCAQSRADAAAICVFCGKAIGYEVPWYNMTRIESITFAGSAHALCAERDAEERAQFTPSHDWQRRKGRSR